MGQKINYDYNSDGKKIFLLYPHSVIRDNLLDTLIMAGFETYTLVDEKKARNLLTKFPDSILFINIDAGLKENEWERYIHSIREDPKTIGSRIGIMSYNQDEELMRKYLIDLSIPCGYIQLKLGLMESTKIILSALEANEARGRRKFIRADCRDDIHASLNFKEESGLYRGKLMDISSSGVTAKFDGLIDFPPKSMLRDVQLRVRGGLLLSDMIMAGTRHDDRNVCIMLFGSKLSSEEKAIIHRYVKICLQKYIDELKL